MKNITLSVDENTLEKAKIKAKLQKTSLNNLFRNWLDDYTKGKNISIELDDFLLKINYVEAGRRFSRDEYNER